MRSNQKINVLIPLAGLGKRFSDAGYLDPKPFINVDGESMITSVIKNLKIPNSRFLFVVREGILPPLDFIKHVSKTGIEFQIITTPILTEGPASTCLLAKQEIDSQNPLLVVNCDQIIRDFDFQFFSDFVQIHDCDGALGCFVSESPKNSYIKLNRDGEVVQTAEKKVISNLATNGLHYWKSGSDFVRSAEQMIQCNDRCNGEFYVAPTYNYLIQEGKKILPYFFNMHFPIGIPEDLKRYQSIIQKNTIL
jgi:dTDP-glucose pyrophosphorylase